MRLPQSESTRLSHQFGSITILLTLAVVLSPRAHGATRQLTCAPSGLRFGEVPIGQTETQYIAVTNNGQTSLILSAIQVGNSEFSMSSPPSLPVTLSPGESIGLNVTFSPTATAWTGGNIVFTTTPSSASLQLPVEGTGVTSDALIAAPTSLSFGQVALGSKVTLPVTVTNVRSWRLTVTALLSVGSAFSVGGPSMPLLINPGQTATFTVTFEPQSAGETGGSVFVKGIGLNIPLTGTGTAIGQLAVAPATLNFGSVDVGTATFLTSTLTATGGSVTVSSASMSNSQFATSGVSFPFTLIAGQSVSVNVSFDPTNAGTDSGSLAFASNASNGLATESLTGTGVNPQYTVNLSWSPSASEGVGYNVYRGTSPGSYSKVNSVLDPNTTYSDNTVIAGTTYYYAATAVDSVGQESSYSTPIEVVVP